MYSERMATAPDIAIRWVTPAGTQTARWGGTTQEPSGVYTVITPLEAKISWSQSCECPGMTWPLA